MTEKKAKALFEKYNPVSDVKRCPRGRMKMRAPLNAYATASVNLYGIIHRDEFVEIFNAHHEEKTTSEEVYTILLPYVHKFGLYGFYKDYIVHYLQFKDFGAVDYLKREQGDKPRYLPPKQEFLKYLQEDYEDNDDWWNLFGFMRDVCESNVDAATCFVVLKEYVLTSPDMKELFQILEKHNIKLSNKTLLDKFIEMVFSAKNNYRIWENKGHTPQELVDFYASKRSEDDPVIRIPKKIAPNEPCPCGSGKKYKKCCSLLENSNLAHLPYEGCKLFYETWYKLMIFVDKKLNVVNYPITPVYGEIHDTSSILKIRNKLWEDPKMIDELLKSGTQFSYKEVSLLQDMEKRHIKGMFAVVQYTPEYAVLMRADKGETPNLYAVKGITCSVAKTLRSRFPIMLETVLLPFGEQIIYDTFITSNKVIFGKELRDSLMNEYAKLKTSSGIITKLL